MDESGIRTLSAGRCFVYLLPCRDEDTSKIGFARDPWTRLRSFHPRFDRFFDLGRGVLMEVDRVAEARAIETELKSRFAEFATPAPLAVRSRAGGRFEWFRGVSADAAVSMQARSEHLGYALHFPLDQWLCRQWLGVADRAVDWCRHEFGIVEMLHHNAPVEAAQARERALRERLELWEGIGLDIESMIGGPAARWYRFGFVD